MNISNSDSMVQARLSFFSGKSLVVSLQAAVLLLILTTPAHAYLDAGTVSIFLQGLIGGLAVAVASISIFWQKILVFLFGKKSEKNGEEQTNEQKSD